MPDRQHARLAAFTQHLHQPGSQVQLIQIQTRQFRQTQPGGVKQFKNRLIALRQKIFFHRTFQQLQGAVGVEGFGQAAFAFGWCQTVGGVVIAQAFAVEVVVQPAHGRQQPRNAARRLTLVMQARHQLTQVLNIQGRPAGD